MVLGGSVILLLGGLSAGAYGIDAYSSSDFIRRTGHAVAVIGKHLYIDGGEVAQYHDGETESQATRQVNDTLSIPLDMAWTNKTVPITSIAKAAPVFDNSALWTDQTGESMFMWGGQGPWGNLSKTKDLWKYSAEDESWKKQPAANVDVFMSIKRTDKAAATQCNGMGFFIGGVGSVWTDSAFDAGDLSVPSPGMLSYNLTSGVWANESLSGLNSFETYISGSAACLPTFGTSKKGMVLTLGGEISKRGGYNSSEPNLVGLGNLTFWDIETKTWFFQQATGEIPSPRSRFCVVDVAGQNGTHEIFLFGGYDGSNQISFEDIYVLSIPGFVWIKTTATTGGPRVAQQCIVAGNRQMIIVGGRNSDLGYYPAYRDPDPWTNGINVLDISNLRWNSEFDPNAAVYESPAAVTEWYNKGNQNDVAWTSDAVKTLFVDVSENSGSADVGSTGSTGSSATTKSSSTRVGPIVGGVIGGLAILALAILAFWLIRRRKLQRNVQPPVQVVGDHQPYDPTSPPLYGMEQQIKSHEDHFSPQGYSQQEVAMLATHERPSELGTALQHELPAHMGNQYGQGEAQPQVVHRNVHEMA